MLHSEELKIIGIIVGSALITIILISAFFYFIGRGKKPKGKKEIPEEEKKKNNKEPTFVDFLVLLLIVGFIAWCIHLYNIKREPTIKRITHIVAVQKVNKENVWKLTWKRSPNVSITFPYKKLKDSFEIKFLKKDSEIMEFISMINGSPSNGTHAILEAKLPKNGRKWEGIYEDKSTGIRGFMSLDEIPDDNGNIMYIGEHSDDQTESEWIPTVIKLKTR